TPAALSTLADRFDRRRLATATSFFMLAPFVGGGLALGAGGALFNWAKKVDRAALPLVGGIEDWQLVFLIVGMVGVVPSMLLLLISDRKTTRPTAAEHGTMNELLGMFRRDWRIYMLYQLAMATMMVLVASYVTWLPAAIMRSKGINEGQIGSLFGPIYLVCGASGTLSAGVVVMMRAGTDPVRTVIRYMLTMLVLLWPVASFGLLTSSLPVELALMGFALFLVSSVISLSSLPFQYLTPRRMRARAMALMAMVTALFGTGLGPVLAGWLSDHLTGFSHPLSIAMALIGAVCVPIVIGLLAVVYRAHARRRLDLSIATDQRLEPGG
ncbi:MAG: hypothetical protein M3N02_05065, partial [Pseudomonadota bacterium]|nr:hypothetical protein [Pseudomonadota bacterium]